MEEKRIVFMGTPDFAVGILEALIGAGLVPAGIVTTPDRPSGRGLKVNCSAVKEYVLRLETEHGIRLPLLQPVSLKDPDFLQALASWQADLFIVVAFRMLPRAVWSMPPLGTFNLHASLLPQYRGAAPINRAIIDGETRTGVTTFFLDEHMDTGAVLDSRSLEIGPDEDAGSLHDRLMALGAELVVETARNIFSGTARTVPQAESAPLRTAPKLHRDTGEIRWNSPARTVHNLIRGLSPYPGAHSVLSASGKNQEIKIYRSARTGEPSRQPAGTVRIPGKGRLQVSCADEWLELLEIQAPGKKRLAVREFLAGWRDTADARFGQSDHKPAQ